MLTVLFGKEYASIEIIPAESLQVSMLKPRAQ
jgi:hypothetical protein